MDNQRDQTSLGKGGGDPWVQIQGMMEEEGIVPLALVLLEL